MNKFLSKIQKNTNSKGCWLWTGPFTSDGYARFCYQGKDIKAHRISYQIYKGPIIDNLHVLHKCSEAICVNPDHLYLGTDQDNMNDKAKVGRQPMGDQIHCTKLTPENVREIRRDYIPRKVSTHYLARKYNVHQRTIWQVLSRKSFKHIV